jgi:hypothetical protein
MLIRSLRRAALAVLLLAATATPSLAQEAQRILPLRISVPEARMPVEISRVDVRAEVAGRHARTRI